MNCIDDDTDTAWPQHVGDALRDPLAIIRGFRPDTRAGKKCADDHHTGKHGQNDIQLHRFAPTSFYPAG